MIVSKFGGTSVGSPENILKVIDIVAKNSAQQAVVVSAMGGVTNMLVEASHMALNQDENYQDLVSKIKDKHLQAADVLLNKDAAQTFAQHLNEELNTLEKMLQGVMVLRDLSEKTEARILGLGELLSSLLIAQAMKARGLDLERVDSRALIKTTGSPLQGAVDLKATYEGLESLLKSNKAKVMLFPGFIARDEKGEASTLGRGGSDFTAAILANGFDAEELEIWTDVSGMFTANPKLVKQAKPIKAISYEEAMELSHFGAKVLYPPTVQPALDKKIDIRIKNTMEPEASGTLITELRAEPGNLIRGISHIDQIALLTLEGNGMIGVPGISQRLFGALAQEEINVKFITQASSEHSICLAIDLQDTALAQKAIEAAFEFEMLQGKIDPIRLEKDLAIIALVGDQMKSHQGISGKMFSELGNNNVNIRAIAQGSSEKNISAVIDAKDVKKALNTLHAAFFEEHTKLVNLFVVGVGNVGGKLLEQLKVQKTHLRERLGMEIRVVGLANSRKMLFAQEGIDLEDWQSQLAESSESSDLMSFFARMKDLNLRNSVFVDNTAHKEVTELYPSCLSESIGVIACNKIACSSDYASYKNLKYLSRKFQAPFLFETNVGAGLPIIDTLNNLVSSGDQVREIQAVLSGSLNFVFNHFDAENDFYKVVVQAGEEGYTEPDPRIDLSGVDVMRKILILMRESGLTAELEDIENDSFLPASSLEAESVEDFLKTLIQEKAHFEQLRSEAEQADCRLKYVASYKDGKASVGLQHIPKSHPFYNLDGKDNIVLFYTDRYQEQPLIVKGAGAGAEVTASGIFGDIIRTSRR